jgi:hypothetical protein
MEVVEGAGEERELRRLARMVLSRRATISNRERAVVSAWKWQAAAVVRRGEGRGYCSERAWVVVGIESSMVVAVIDVMAVVADWERAGVLAWRRQRG